MSVPIILTTCLISLLYTKIGDYLAIFGGMFAVPACFFIPGMYSCIVVLI